MLKQVCYCIYLALYKSDWMEVCIEFAQLFVSIGFRITMEIIHVPNMMILYYWQYVKLVSVFISDFLKVLSHACYLQIVPHICFQYCSEERDIFTDLAWNIWKNNGHRWEGRQICLIRWISLQRSISMPRGYLYKAIDLIIGSIRPLGWTLVPAISWIQFGVKIPWPSLSENWGFNSEIVLFEILKSMS